MKLISGRTTFIPGFRVFLLQRGAFGVSTPTTSTGYTAQHPVTGNGSLVAVTDRRIITAKTNAFLEQGEIREDIPIDRVRYVRAAATQDRSARLAIDLITRDENIRWLFHADIDNAQIDALAAVLAESMTIPDVERDELQRRSYAAIEAGSKGESTSSVW